MLLLCNPFNFRILKYFTKSLDEIFSQKFTLQIGIGMEKEKRREEKIDLTEAYFWG